MSGVWGRICSSVAIKQAKLPDTTWIEGSVETQKNIKIKMDSYKIFTFTVNECE